MDDAFGPSSWEEEKQVRLAAGWLDPHSFSEFDDGTRLVGQRVFVSGHGEGTVRAFRKQMSISGGSPHEVDFDDADGRKEVKLRRKGNSETPWLLGPHIYASLATEWGDEEISFVVSTITGQRYSVSAVRTDSIVAIKRHILQQAGIPIAAQRIVRAGVELEDTQTLADCGVADKESLHLTLKLTAEEARAGEDGTPPATETAAEPEPEPEPEPQPSAEEQELFLQQAEEARSHVVDIVPEADTDDQWVDGSSLDDTPRHMLIDAEVLIELSDSMRRELYSFEGEARAESSPRASPFARALVVGFTKKRIGDSVHTVDFTLNGRRKTGGGQLGKQDLVLECAGHSGDGCNFQILRSKWHGLLKDKVRAGGREQRLCVVYENQRSQTSLGLSKLGMGAARMPSKEDFDSEHLIGHLDRPHWSSVDGKPMSDPSGAAPPEPPQGFRWDTDRWSVGARGWEYASGWNDEWTTEINEKSTVRRMRWERMLIREDPVMYVVENQRRIRKGGFDRWSVAALRQRDDCPAWCQTDLVAAPPKPYLLPNKGCQWDGEWEAAPIGQRVVDDDGWSYGQDFLRSNKWGAKSDESAVRQRCWRRKMKPIPPLSQSRDRVVELLVRLHRAESLSASSPSSCNTYAIVTLGSTLARKTSVVHGTASPTWNELMRFTIPVQVSQLQMEGLETLNCRIVEERMGGDEVLGEVRINLVELLIEQQDKGLHRKKVHLSHTAYQEQLGRETTPASVPACLPTAFLNESWYHLHPQTSKASTESWDQGLLQVGIGLREPRGSSAPSAATTLGSCTELQHLCEKISSDHSEEARKRCDDEFRVFNGGYAVPWVVRPHWFENRTRWNCEQEHALLRWAVLLKQKEKDDTSINEEAGQTSQDIMFAPPQSLTTHLPMALIGSKYTPAKALQPDVLSLVRRGMPGREVWQRNRHIEDEEGIPPRTLETLRGKMWYTLTGGKDLSAAGPLGNIMLTKERVDELRKEAVAAGAKKLLFPVNEDGTATVRGYHAMSICTDVNDWLGLGEKRGGFKAGEDSTAQIKKDIPRTEVSSTPAESAALYRMLLTFARRYPAVGYCQGMNNIALAVLRTTGTVNEQQGFWTFAGLCDRVCPGYYSESMTGVQVDAQVIERLTKEQHAERNPRVNIIDHMSGLGYPVMIKVTQWLINLFIGAMPMPMLQALWDWLVVDGTCALICFAATLLSHLREEILKCTDFQQCSEVLSAETVPHSTNAYIECERAGPRLLREGQELYERVGAEKIQSLRHEAIDEIVGRNKDRTRKMYVRKLTGSTSLSKEGVERLHEAFDLARKKSPDLRSTMVTGHQTPWEERVIDYKAFVIMMKIEIPELAQDEEMLQNLFNAFDDDRSGFVDEQEFIVGLSTLISGGTDNMDDKLRMCFSTADSSNDGRVGKDELKKLLESCYKLARTRALTSEEGDEPSGSTDLSEQDQKLKAQVEQEVEEYFESIDGKYGCSSLCLLLAPTLNCAAC
jgi:Ca2+-binding EF-hand superfamily protein